MHTVYRQTAAAVQLSRARPKNNPTPTPPTEHKRRPYLYRADFSGPTQEGYYCSTDFMGGPHSGGSPCLFADGGVALEDGEDSRLLGSQDG